MKKFLALFASLLFINLIVINPACCWEIKNKYEYLLDVRGDDGDIVLNRVYLRNNLNAAKLEITAFGETQWNFETSNWEKITIGTKIGKYLRKYLYLSQSIQLISGEILDYMAFDINNNSIDSTTTIALDLPLVKNLSLNIFEEYSINLEECTGEYCETGIELNYDFKKTCSLGFGWRHTDRIHNFDTDYVSTSLTLNF